MDLAPESHNVLTDLKLSEVQHFLTSIHEEANGHIFLDALHNLEWTALALAGEAGELANKIKKIRRDQVDVLSLTEPAHEALQEIRDEAGDVATYLIVVATLLGMSLSDFLDLACSRAATFAEGKGLDLAGIASRGGVLFKYVIPSQVLPRLSPEQREQFHDTNAQPRLPDHYGHGGQRVVPGA